MPTPPPCAQGKSFGEIKPLGRYENVTTLTVPILRALIDSIVVHQAEGGKILNRTQKVVINFRFIRELEFTECEARPRNERSK